MARADTGLLSTLLGTEVIEHLADADAAFAGLRRLCTWSAPVVITSRFIFPLQMEPYDFRRLTLFGFGALGVRHGFRVETSVRLGGDREVLAMLLADASILPTAKTVYAPAKGRTLRLAVRGLIRALDSPALRRHLVIDSNGYLNDGFILRAS